ncbi:Cytochrome-b5 reductase [Purpureocillium takamizusanense]|uniref:NADH-cytochrome b5 reductase n=1 Tax=Purpureocillium takamizusanense TaxID=2060973 RepID=A0A9Q8QBM6_9HYPO|nr:Cytochrome-b5 reductase [Purpureocillium takamizusanense]UNI16049.1 Cytochrome-b5 reductase [Purpureocillium takamizusanense]
MSSATVLRSRVATVVGTVAATGAAVGVASRFYSGGPVRADSPASPRRVFGGGPAFVSLPLESSETVNHNTKRLRFRLPEKDAVSGLSLTSALLTFSWPKNQWLPVIRPYTPVSSSDEPGFVDFLVKRYPDGKLSTHLHSLEPGQSLRFLAALKGPQWTPNQVPNVVLIAGGAGVTPCYQLAQGILRNPEDRTAVTLVYGANSDADVLLRDELTDWERRFPGRFRVVYTVSRPAEGSKYRQGYVNEELLRTSLTGVDGKSTKVFVCGPPAMEKSLVGDSSTKGVLEALGYRKDQVATF